MRITRFQQESLQLNRNGICAPMSDAWLASQRAEQPLFVGHPVTGVRIRGQLLEPLMEYAQDYYGDLNHHSAAAAAGKDKAESSPARLRPDKTRASNA